MSDLLKNRRFSIYESAYEPKIWHIVILDYHWWESNLPKLKEWCTDHNITSEINENTSTIVIDNHDTYTMWNFMWGFDLNS